MENKTCLRDITAEWLKGSALNVCHRNLEIKMSIGDKIRGREVYKARTVPDFVKSLSAI